MSNLDKIDLKTKLILSGPYPYKEEEAWGGVESVLKNLSRGLDKNYNGIDYNILTNTSKCDKKYEYHKDTIYIKNPKITLGSIFLSVYPRKIKKILKNIEFNILNSHSLDFSYYALKNKNKLLFTLHGVTWEEEKYLSFFKRIGWKIFYSNRLKKVLKELKYLVSISPYVTNLVKDYTTAKIFEIPNPIPEEYFRLKDRSKENRIFYIGVISRRKNLLELVKALKIVKEHNKKFELFVAGKVKDQDYFDKIKKYVLKHNLEDEIKFLGLISKEEKYNQLEKMNFLVLPSLQETAPMVISEAFSAGKPVIASDVGGTKYMLGEEKRGLLINPKDKNDIAKKIIYFLDNKKVAKEMGKKAKRYALQNYHIDVVTNSYVKAYQYVLNR